MARTYIPAYKGYITDVPEIWFKRNDGKVFHYDQISQANVTPQVNYTEVNGGWSLYPVAYLPAQSSMEMSFTSAQFSTDLFSLANDLDFKNRTVAVPHTVYLDRDTTVTSSNVYKFTTKEVVDLASIQVDGLKKNDDEELIAGEWKVESQTLAEGAGTEYTVTAVFGTDDLVDGKAPTTLSVFYEETKTLPSIRVDNKRSAIGELIAKYPVYSAGDEQQAGGVKGFVMVRIYRCRATAMPGFDTSYKSAASNQVTFGTLESKQTDGAAYTISYFDNTNDDTAVDPGVA